MRICKIEAAGFRGIRFAIEVPISSGFVVVSGRNGSGKSTLFDAIEFALSGRITRPALLSEAGENINNYVWWRGPGDAPSRYVAISLADDSGGIVEITRRPDGVTVFKIGPSGDRVEIDEAALAEILAGEEAAEEGALGRLCVSSIIRDEQITGQSVDAPERERFSFVREAIGSTKLPEIEERLTSTKRILDSRIQGLEADYERARADVNRLVSRISEARSELESHSPVDEARSALVSALGCPDDLEAEEMVRRARERTAQLRPTVSVISRCLPQLAEVERRRAEIETEGFEREDGEYQAALETADRLLADMKGKREAAEVSAREFESRQPRVHSMAELVEHGRRVGLTDGRCPLCGSDIAPEAFDAHMESTAAAANREVDGLTQGIEKRAAAMQAERETEDGRRQAETVLRNHRRRAQDLATESEELMVEVRALEGVDPSVELGPAALGVMLDQMRGLLGTIERSLAAIEASSAYERVLGEERSLEQARQEQASVEKALEGARRAQSKVSEAIRIVRRVAREFVDERLAELEPLLLELYSRLRPHVQWSTVGYRIRGDVRGFLRLTVGDDLNPRFMFSSGQRRALGLAFLLSVHLATTWSRWNTLVLDDPMQHVDDYRALHLVEVLAAIRKSGRQVLCAVEDSALADLLCRRLATSDEQEGSVVHLRYEHGMGSKVAEATNLPQMIPHLITAA